MDEKAQTVRKHGRNKTGSTKWCKQCSRFHPRYQVCDLYLRTREINGEMVKRWAH